MPQTKVSKPTWAGEGITKEGCLAWCVKPKQGEGVVHEMGGVVQKAKVPARTEGHLYRGRPHIGHQSLSGVRGCPY